MKIIGCDYHPSWQQICWMETATGEMGEAKLEHTSGEATRLSAAFRACFDRDGVDGELSVVCGDGRDRRARGVDWGCRQDSRERFAAAEE